MPQCVALRCHNSSGCVTAEGKKTFHRFPKNPEKRQLWVSALRREAFQPGNNTRLCGDHFEQSCFLRTGKLLRLKDDAIPTIFDFSNEETVEKGSLQKQKESAKKSNKLRKIPAKDSVPVPSSCPTEAATEDTEQGPFPDVASWKGPKSKGQQESQAKGQKAFRVPYTRAKGQHKIGPPHAMAKGQNKFVVPYVLEVHKAVGTLGQQEVESPCVATEGHEEFEVSLVKVERQQGFEPCVKGEEPEEFGSSSPIRVEEHREFGLPPVHSLAYLQWKCLGAQQGLEEDRDIACFLLRYYEHTSKVMLSGLTGACKTCGTPLSISCHRCDWTINADAPCTSPPHQTSGNTAAEREGGGDGTGGGDRGGHPLHHHPPRSADGLSPSLVVGSAESEDMKSLAEAERDGTEKTTGKDFRDEKTMGEDICDEKTMGEDIRGATDTVGRRTADHHQPFLVLTVEDSVDPDCDSARDFPAETRDDSSSAHPSREIVDDSEPCVTDDCHEDNHEDNNDNSEESEGDTGDDDADDSCRYVQGDAEHEDTASICDVGQENNPLVCEGEEEEDGVPAREDSDAASVCFVVHANDGTGEALTVDDTEDAHCVVHANDGTGEALTLDDTEDAHRRCQALDAQHTTTLDGSEATWMHLLDEESVGIGEPSALDTKPPCFSDHASDGTTLESSSLEGQTCLPVQATDDDTGETVHDDSEAVDHATDGPRESPVADNSHGAADVLQHGVNDSAAEPSATDCTRPSPHCAPGHTDDKGEGKPRQDYLDGTGKCLLDHSYHFPSTGSGHVPVQCHTCGKNLKNTKSLRAHQQIHRGDSFICDVCGKLFKLASSLRKHRSIHSTEKPFKCDICGLAFHIKHLLWRHQKVHDKGFVCDTCGKVFRAERTLKRHSLSHTDQKPFVCSTCGRTFRGERRLRTHSLIHRDQKQFVCDTCGKVFRGQRGLKNHSLIHTDKNRRQFVCDMCGKTFVKEHNLNRHKECHTTVPSPRTYICDQCGQIFTQADSLWRHRRNVHIAHQKTFACKVCSKSFWIKLRLEEHERVHTGEKPFICNTCGVAFTQISNLRRHTKGHEGHRPFMCVVCNKYFTAAFTLKIHMMIHSGQKPFPCDLCNRRFRSTGILNIHKKKTHTNTHTKQGLCIKCDVCGRALSTTAALKRHKLSHLCDQDQDRVFSDRETHECDICGKHFPYRCLLENHKRVQHLDDKFQGTFTCHRCGKVFTNAGNLVRHQLTHTGIKAHQCDICHKSFTQMCSMKKHKLIHTGLRPFKCDICSKTFTERGTLTKHKKIHDRSLQTSDTPLL